MLYDPYGNDVTEEYEIVTSGGKISIYDKVIKIYLYEKCYEYNGKERTYDPDEYMLIEEYEGLELVMKNIKISLKDKGKIDSAEVNANSKDYFDFEVYLNGEKVDLSENYTILVVDYEGRENYTLMEITERKITLSSASASKPYDGKSLTKEEFYVSLGTLAEGHKAYLEVNGSVSKKGEETPNTIKKDSLIIVDENGKNVTSNYQVNFKLGTLKIT